VQSLEEPSPTRCSARGVVSHAFPLTLELWDQTSKLGDFDHNNVTLIYVEFVNATIFSNTIKRRLRATPTRQAVSTPCMKTTGSARQAPLQKRLTSRKKDCHTSSRIGCVWGPGGTCTGGCCRADGFADFCEPASEPTSRARSFCDFEIYPPRRTVQTPVHACKHAPDRLANG
jgi:hypothetical protein